MEIRATRCTLTLMDTGFLLNETHISETSWISPNSCQDSQRSCVSRHGAMNTLTSPKTAESDPSDDPTERQLIERCRAGDSGAIAEIVARYHEHVARVACRLSGHAHDVDDVVQDVFLRVLQRIGTFRADASFSTWLIAITVNCCRSRWKREALRKRLLWSHWRNQRSNKQPHQTERSSNLVGRVQDAVANMPATYREPIILRYLEELSISEIAQILVISTAAVEARLSRGRQCLKSILTNCREQ